MRRVFGAGTAATVLLLASCGMGPDSAEDAAERQDPAPTSQTPPGEETGEDADEGTGHDGHGADAVAAEPPQPLRAGERFLTLAMPEPYTPSAPEEVGTDDYRCFVLDPGLDERSFVTGIDVLPGTRHLVHHVILFRVPPDQVAATEAQDAAEDGQGWTCFGGTGLGGGGGNPLTSAPWIGAWAPGGGESLLARDVGIPLEPGSRIVMQVHYNLLAGQEPDVTSARLRVAPGTKDLAPLETMLLVAPVELPCRDGVEGELCDRDAAVNDVADRFGNGSAFLVGGLQVYCGDGTPDPGPVQSCDRRVEEPITVRAVGGHMHLLGKKIGVELNPGQPGARTLLDVDPWNFDDQGAVPVRGGARVAAGDTLRLTCEHDQSLREMLPALADVPERYVVWGEGTTDEMCLGLVLYTRDGAA